MVAVSHTGRQSAKTSQAAQTANTVVAPDGTPRSLVVAKQKASPLACGATLSRLMLSGVIAGSALLATADMAQAASVVFNGPGTLLPPYGTLPSASGTNASAGGDGAVASGTRSTAVGYQASATATNATALGFTTQASGTGSTALGGDAFATDVVATAVGANSRALGAASTSVGSGAKSLAEGATAVGRAAEASEINSAAYGRLSKAGAARSVAVGFQSSASAADALAMGPNAVAGQANNVALGANSISDVAHTGPYTINGGVAAATTSAGGTVSVGTAGAERQIQNVAAGVVSATSTDAINGSQLYAVGTAVNTAATGAANGLGGGAGWDAATGAFTGPTYTVAGNSYNNVGDALGATNTSVNNLGATTASALGGGSTYSAGQGVTAPNYAVQGGNYNNVGDALGALNTTANTHTAAIASLNNSVGVLGLGLAGVTNQVQGNQREARQGIAIAMSMPNTHFPSAPGKTTISSSIGTYKGYGGLGFAAMHRFDTPMPLAAGVSVAAGMRNSYGIRGELVSEF